MAKQAPGIVLSLALNLASGPPSLSPMGMTSEVPPACVSLHHLHLNDLRPPSLLAFYERLFDPATTRRVTTGGADGLQSGPMLILIGRGSSVREQVTALWHFGWGAVSLGETYLAHARREVAWEPPLPAGRLHLHVRSVTPRVAAAWYRDVLGARVEFPAAPVRAGAVLPLPEHRMPEALVWLGETGLLIYRAEPPLLSTRGQRIDHVAITCADLDAALADLGRRGTTVLTGPAIVGDLRTALIEGPDHLALELVEQRASFEAARP